MRGVGWCDCDGGVDGFVRGIDRGVWGFVGEVERVGVHSCLGIKYQSVNLYP